LEILEIRKRDMAAWESCSLPRKRMKLSLRRGEGALASPMANSKELSSRYTGCPIVKLADLRNLAAIKAVSKASELFGANPDQPAAGAMHNTNEIHATGGSDQVEGPPSLAAKRTASSDAEAQLILPDASKFTSQELFRQLASKEARPRNPWLSIANRLLDVLGSALLLVLLLPVMVVLFVLVAVSSRGLPIFAHRRVGKGGRPFNCYKFRSMCHDAEARLEKLLKQDPALLREWTQHHKLTNDPRITRLGHFLRQSSLDELPQLFNVLVGDMSLVGPRPIVQAEIDHYGRHIHHYLDIKPGLTGLWQVTCRSESTYLRRVAIDRVYAQNKCLLLDLRILFATVPAVVSRKGAV
jgi:exopolysaccharide production protein ExoY